MTVIHEVIFKPLLKNPYYACKACSFRGDLSQAVEHTVSKQFTVVEKNEPRTTKQSF
jgi:hypothetical protein